MKAVGVLLPFLARFSGTIPIDQDGNVPDEIQWMPPGRHEIKAWQAGEPVTRVVTVNETTALQVMDTFEDIMRAAREEMGDLPYIDFNHEDREAAGHVLGFRWAGEDPVSGGVRAKVRWTGPGETALRGRAYRRFSPSFYMNAEGEVIGAPVNMGGLVNKPAFKTIEPIWSRQADHEANPTKGPSMDPMQKELAELRAAISEKDSQITVLNAKLAAANQADIVKARDTEIGELKAQVAQLTHQIAVKAREAATTLVEAAAKAGKIPPQNKELQEKWINAICSDASLAETLNALPANPATVTIVHKPAGDQQQQAVSAQENSPEQFVQLVKARLADGKTRGQAVNLVINSHPEAYRAWREAGGQPALG